MYKAYLLFLVSYIKMDTKLMVINQKLTDIYNRGRGMSSGHERNHVILKKNA